MIAALQTLAVGALALSQAATALLKSDPASSSSLKVRGAGNDHGDAATFVPFSALFFSGTNCTDLVLNVTGDNASVDAAEIVVSHTAFAPVVLGNQIDRVVMYIDAAAGYTVDANVVSGTSKRLYFFPPGSSVNSHTLTPPFSNTAGTCSACNKPGGQCPFTMLVDGTPVGSYKFH
jgi:hypothetical protein